MPDLIAYMISRVAIGFALGATSGIFVILLNPVAVESPSDPLEWGLVIYGFGAPFAMGYLATQLATESD
ncbi:MAG TPA: hypothetical protein VGO22_17100 [Pseudorhizobium sp.]|jgi:hypothetical protein|nr:hypothetical protein [Pseudorhizobium sp.]